MYWCIIRSFQADGAFLEATFMVVALSFAVAVPSSPGFIGIFQLVGQQALVLPFGAKYDESQALAITVTAHLTYYLLTTALRHYWSVAIGRVLWPSWAHAHEMVIRRNGLAPEGLREVRRKACAILCDRVRGFHWQ